LELLFKETYNKNEIDVCIYFVKYMYTSMDNEITQIRTLKSTVFASSP